MRMKTSVLVVLALAALLSGCGDDKNSGDASGSGNAAGGAGGIGAGGRPGRGAPGSQEDFQQSAGDRVFFDTDRSNLTEQARSILDKQAAWLKQYPQANVWIAGNCDERGTEEYNIALGQRRANADKSYLVAQGIAAARLETISYGKARPIDAGSSPESYAQNRNAITSLK
jgi:peptidoglycan-associated lipoprotein